MYFLYFHGGKYKDYTHISHELYQLYKATGA
jgi:hypothetical protein